MDDFKRDIAGALKQTIHAHGPITEGEVSSAAKRIARAIREAIKRERDDHMAHLDEDWMRQHGWVRDRQTFLSD